MSKSTWDTILARTMLHDLPCTSEGCDYRLGEIHFCVSEDTPACEIEDICPLRPIYEEYLKLRAVVMAMFVRADGSAPTPERVLKGLRGWRDEAIEDTEEWSYYDGLVKAVEGIAEKLEALEEEE